MAAVTVWVLARPDDPGLPVLAEAPPGARLVTGAQAEDFADAPPADAILVCSLRRDTLDPVLALAPRARWVHSRAAGVDAILSPALVAADAVVTSGRGVFSRALAEFVIGAVLFFAKGFRRMVRSQEEGRWDPFEAEDVEGRTLGIVGYGDIGRAVAARARALGMRILALRRRPERSRADPLADEVLPLEARLDLLGRADDVVVSLPLTAETRRFVGEAELAAMKKTAVLVNVGRGPVVDEDALVRALTGGRIRGAALDVFETEPLPAGHPFYKMDNVLLSPHCGDRTPGWLDGGMRFFLRNLDRFRRGEALESVVDKKRGY
jgi:phosphoglycerate dehydrogenase-like enzyme